MKYTLSRILPIQTELRLDFDSEYLRDRQNLAMRHFTSLFVQTLNTFHSQKQCVSAQIYQVRINDK